MAWTISKTWTASALIACSLLLAPCASRASWYWPFGEDEPKEKKDQPRLSELMEPATTNIDAAADFAAEGKFKEAQDSYRAAIAALSKIEAENPERASTPEFATVRNKRAYVNAALDSMLLAEARENAKAVAVTDTTALEVKMAERPWQTFQSTYEALTNDYRIIMRRIAYIEEDEEAHRLLNAVADPGLQVVCVSNITGIATNKSVMIEQWKALTAAYDATAAAIGKMKHFSENVDRPGGVQVFDVCRRDVRKGVAACADAWPKVGASLDRVNRHLDGVRDVLLEEAAQRDFALVADRYAKHAKDVDVRDIQGYAMTNGYLQTHRQLLAGLEDPDWVNGFTGAVRRVELNWGGAVLEVPLQEEDRGLVKDGGDDRPKVESQITAHVEKERKRAKTVKKAANKARMSRRVQKEVKKLFKADPKSRKARMLMAGEDLRNGDTAAAKAQVKALLDEKPNDGSALNLRAAIEAAEGDLKASEKTLDQAIQSNPRDYHAYYNMASIYLQRGNVDGARRYYETGRSFKGPKNEELEKAVKTE